MPYHEPVDELSPQARDMHRALCSLIEELEAVNWYNQRADVTPSPDLQAVLLHNRDEEIEHAAMTLEWIRRQIPKFDEELRTYLFTSGSITAVEEGGESASAESRSNPSSPASSDLGIGSLKKGG